MSETNPNSPEPTVFLLTNIGNDARNAAAVLKQGAIHTRVCADLRDVCDHANEQTGALVIGEEMLDQKSINSLLEFLLAQPAWSDIPLVLLTSSGDIHPKTYKILDFIGARANVTLLEKPLRALTLISVVKTALRARKRQHEIRDLLAQLETLVQHRTAKLQETVGELEAFSYSIAHDMRAPLRSLHGFSKILLSDHGEKLDAEGQKFLQRIATSASRMDTLIRDVLNYSQIVRGDLSLEKVDVRQLLREIINTYPMLAPDKADIVLKGSFPAVLGNEAMLTQIFSNLMGNGVKFVAPGVRPQLLLWAEKGAEGVRFFVQDNGIGIPSDQHEKIFGIFQRVTKGYEGTGIGLAIVKKAAERMGGKVGLKSEPSKGSTFWIEIQEAPAKQAIIKIN